MLHKVYSIGYQGSSHEDLKRYADGLNAVVADIRFSARSKNPLWSQRALGQLLGERYLYLNAFGNKNYRSGPIELDNPAAGVAVCERILAEQCVILMCACWNQRECHRTVAAELLAERLGVTIEHLPGKVVRWRRAGELPPPPPPPPPGVEQLTLF